MTANQMLYIGWSQPNVMSFGFFGDSLDVPGYIDQDEWHHWTMVFDHVALNQSMYRDGVLIASRQSSGRFFGSNTCQVGAYTAGLRAYIDEFRIWNRALSTSDITTQFANRDLYSPASYKHGLSLVYNFDDPTNLALDSSGNALHGTMNGQIVQQPAIITQACGTDCTACATARICSACSSSTFLWNGQCQKSCPSGMLRFYTQCVVTCPAHTIQTANNCTDPHRELVFSLSASAYYPMQENSTRTVGFVEASNTGMPAAMFIPGFAPIIPRSGPFFSSLNSAYFSQAGLLRAETPFHVRLNPTSSGTVSLWANPFANNGDYQSPVTCRSVNQRGWMFYITPTGDWNAWGGNTGGWTVAAGPKVRFGSWEHVVLRFTTTAISLYVNGQFYATTNGNISPNLDTKCTIGHGAPENAFPGVYYYTGYMSDLTVIPSALNDAQILSLFTTRACPHFSAPYTIINATCYSRANATRLLSPPSFYSASSLIRIAVDFTELVYVTGSPQLLLALNATDPTRSRVGVASYVSGSGSRSLTFTYVVQPADTTSGNIRGVLDVVNSTSALFLPSGTTILDQYGQPSILTNVSSRAVVGSMANDTPRQIIIVPDATSDMSCNVTRLAASSTASCTLNPRYAGVSIYTLFSYYTLVVAQGFVFSLPLPSTLSNSFSFFYTAPSATACVFLHDSVSAQPLFLEIGTPVTPAIYPLLLGSTLSLTVIARNASSSGQSLLLLDSNRITLSDGGVNGVFNWNPTVVGTQLSVTWQAVWGRTPTGLTNLTATMSTNPPSVQRLATVAVFMVPDSSSYLQCPNVAVVGSTFNCTVFPRKGSVSVNTFSYYFGATVLNGLGRVTGSAATATGGNFGSSFTVMVTAGQMSGQMTVWDGVSAQSVTVSLFAANVNAGAVGCP